MSRPTLRAASRHALLRWALAGLAAGALGFAALGETPAGQRAPAAAPPAFVVSEPVDGSAAAAAIAGLALWASQPAAPTGPVVEPPPRVVGIVTSAGGAREAVFEFPDGRRQRAKAGDAVPGLGAVVDVTATAVRWRAASGDLLESRLFLDAQARPVPDAATDDP